jgi:hypothetical protein
VAARHCYCCCHCQCCAAVVDAAASGADSVVVSESDAAAKLNVGSQWMPCATLLGQARLVVMPVPVVVMDERYARKSRYRCLRRRSLRHSAYDSRMLLTAGAARRPPSKKSCLVLKPYCASLSGRACAAAVATNTFRVAATSMIVCRLSPPALWSELMVPPPRRLRQPSIRNFN